MQADKKNYSLSDTINIINLYPHQIIITKKHMYSKEEFIQYIKDLHRNKPHKEKEIYTATEQTLLKFCKATDLIPKEEKKELSFDQFLT